MGKEITERSSFIDTKDVNVEKMAAIGVVTGVGNNRFAPNNNLTREQAAVVLSRLAKAVGEPLTKKAASFADTASISSWAIEPVGEVQAAGIMSGVGSNRFAPKNPYTREQSIITIIRIYNIVSDKSAQTSIEMYSDFPTVPDFGAFAGKAVIDVSEITGNTSKSTFYTYSSVPFSSSIIDDYFKFLLSLGFEYTSSHNRNSYIQVYNPKTDIIVGCAPDDANIFIQVNVPL